MLPPDATLHNRYRVIYAVDERPGSTVYRARDEQTGRLMLVSQIAVPQGDEPGAAFDDVRLLARQVATLRHDALLPLVDHFGADESYYLVCEDVGGQDLERALRARGGPLPEGPTLQQLQRMLGLLEQLHEQKPALFLGDPLPVDLWIGDSGEWRLAPFTLVRTIASAPSPYRAPELARPDAEPSAASDMYALAALLYQALTGWAPPTAAQREAGTPLNGPRALNPGLSTLAEQVLLRGLQLKPENRYQVARELRMSIEMVQIMDGRALGSGPDVAPPSAQPALVLPEGYAAPAPQQPPVYPAPQPPSPAPGVYPAPQPPQQPPVYPAPMGQPYQPPVYAAPERKRGLSTGCLVALAVLLTLAAVAICAALGLYFYTAGRAFLLGPPQAAAITPAPAAASLASNGSPTAQAEQPTAAAGQAAGAAELPTPQPASLGPRAITLANAATIQETREITAAVLGPVAFSPDGKFLAVGIDKAVELRDPETLDNFDPPRRMVGHTSMVFTLAWSPDGQIIASGASVGDNTIRLWNPADGSLVRELKGHTDWIRAVAFSPDGKLLASGGYDKTVRIWDVASGNLVRTLNGHSDFISTVAFAPDGKTLASSAADGVVRLWDVATGQQDSGFTYESTVDLATGQRLWTTGLAFAPDGKMLAIGLADGSVALVEPGTGKLIRTLTGHTGIVVSRGVAFAPDGKTLATASFDGTVRLWDVASGAQTGEFTRHDLRVLSISFSPDGARLASTSDQSGQLFVWDVRQPQQSARSSQVGQGLIIAVDFSPDGSLLGSVGYNGTLRLYDIGRQRSQLLVGSAASKSLAFLGAGRIAAITQEGALVIAGPNDPQPTLLTGLDGQPLNVAASADGKLVVAGSSTGAIGRWDSPGGAAKPALRSQQLKAIYELAVNEDGTLIAASGPSDDVRIELWDAASGTLRHTLAGSSSGVTALAFQPHGKLLAATDLEGKLRIWNTDDGALLKTISATPQQRRVSALAF
jgi:WD40 repeat protein